MLLTVEWKSKSRKASKLLLNFKDITVEISDQRTNVNLSRADDNDVVVKGNLISRIHAKNEVCLGKLS